QAEDGIRDFHVTGVQTCALPILRLKQGDPQAALLHIDDAIVLATELGSSKSKGPFRLTRGDAQLALGQLEAAEQEYLVARSGPGGKLEVDAVAGLAGAALARGDSGAALEVIKPVLDVAMAGEISLVSDPLRAYLTFHAVLRVVHDARAHPVLEAARKFVTDIMAKIDDQAALETFKARADVTRLVGS